MYISPDDAKSDVILAAATLLFGGLARAIVVQLPVYPRQGVVVVLLDLVWIVLLTAAVPWWLSRYRGDGLAAFGLDGDRGAIGVGIVLAIPVVVAQFLLAIVAGRGPVSAALGNLGFLTGATPGPGALATVVVLARVVLVTVGATLVIAFLAVRSREAFPRSPDTSMTELLRTFGMGAAGVALVIGLLRSAFGPTSPIAVLLYVGGLVAVLLLTDRRIPARAAVPRATVVAPMIIVVVVHIFATGGFLRGDLPGGLYSGAIGAGIAIAMSTLVQSRATAWAIVPLMVAAHWWSGLFSPLAL